MDAAALRAEFPVLERLAYLNAGTDGPIPARGGRRRARGARRRARRRAASTRTSSAASSCTTQLRDGYARVLGCAAGGRRAHHLDERRDRARARRARPRPRRRDPHLRPGAPGADRAADRRPPARRDGPRGADARARRRGRAGDDAGGLLARELDHRRDRARRAGASSTCRSSSTAPRAPARCRSTSQALGCAAYAASGQKWLCGADGTGMLYLAPAFRARVRVIAPGYLSLRRTPRGASTSDAARRRAGLRHAASRARRRRSRSPRCGCSRRAGWDAVHAARGAAWPPSWPSALRASAGRRVVAARRDDARELRGPRSAGDPRAARRGGRRDPRPTRDTRCCAPRSAPGTTRRTSSVCSPRWPDA